MQVPCALIPTAENQIPIAEGMEREGMGLNLGWHAGISVEQIARSIESLVSCADRRSVMEKRARMVIDGHGAARVAARLLMPPVTLRPASIEDAALLWNWRNDPPVRSLSFSSDPIPWQEHLQWFQHKLKDPQSRIYIGIDDYNEPTGQIRVEPGGTREAEVHISVDPARRGRGYGSSMLIAIQENLFRLDQVDTIHAFIKPANSASIRSFEKTGFVDKGLAELPGQVARHYVCTLRESLS